MWGYGFLPMAAYGLLHLLFWLAVLGLVIWAVRAFVVPRSRQGDETPLLILQKRFARGEITEAEYQQAAKVLS